jgi:hypothetical protein
MRAKKPATGLEVEAKVGFQLTPAEKRGGRLCGFP